VTADGSRPTEIRIAGHLYYVAQIEGSQSGRQQLDGAKPRAAPIAAEAGRQALPKLPYVPAPNLAIAARTPALPAAAAPAPLPAPARIQRQQARAFVPPQLKPNPAATQTIIQPLSPLDVVPPPTPLPNFRITADVSQMRKIPKPFVAPGRVKPVTPAPSPNVDTPSPDLVPTTPAPPGEPLTIFSLSDHPIPFSDKVLVPAGNIAQPAGGPVVETAANGTAAAAGGIAGGTPAGAAGGTPNSTAASTSGAAAAARAGSGSASAAPAAASGAGSVGARGATTTTAANGPGAANGNATAGGTGNAAVGSGNGAALTGGVKNGDTTAIVGGAGASSGSTPTPGTGTGAGSGATPGTGSGTTGNGPGRGNTPGSNVIIHPATGNFDAVVVQSSPTDQYPESRGLLSGRPIYSVYISVGNARDWTLFFCVPGEKPEPGNSRVVTLGPAGPGVKAPYPTKLVKPSITLPSWEKYVLVHGVVNKEGRFENLRVVRSIKPETDQSLLLSLSEWEFRAASRDGSAIAVEFLLSIPVRGL